MCVSASSSVDDEDDDDDADESTTNTHSETDKVTSELENLKVDGETASSESKAESTSNGIAAEQ